MGFFHVFQYLEKSQKNEIWKWILETDLDTIERSLTWHRRRPVRYASRSDRAWTHAAATQLTQIRPNRPQNLLLGYQEAKVKV